MKLYGLLSLLIITLILTTSVQAKQLETLNIAVNLEKEGNATINEIYTFTLETIEEQDDFLTAITNYGASTSLWRAYDENLYTHFGTSSNIIAQATSAKQDAEKAIIELNYEVQNTAIKKQENGQEWELNNQNINFPVRSGLLELMGNTTITINLPENAEVLDVAPQAQIRGRTVIWQGPTVTNQLQLNYELQRVAVPTTSIQLLPLDPTTTLILAVLLLVLSVIAVIKKKTIKENVQEYVITPF